jgi:signal transduction histidine kinase
LADVLVYKKIRVAPVLHAGELLGVLALELDDDAAGLRPSDETTVVELARQVGLALHNVELDNALQASLDEVRAANDELRQSRARIVAAGDAERRKLERNLHDGAQQHLVALAVNLRLVRDIVSEDAEGASEMLGMLADSVKDTIEELRALAHGIYPPLLVDSGLGEALRAAAGRSPLPVEVEANDIGRHSAEVEAAVYFCCLEALQNAAKHAPESHVVVHLDDHDGRVSFEVSDDGPGFDLATATAGHGYTNMSDRLGAIGGTVTWESSPGNGATISGWVPAAPTSR